MQAATKRILTNLPLAALLVAVFVWQKVTGVEVTGNAFADSLMHGNWAHLALNCWGVLALWRKPRWAIIPAYLIGCFGISLEGNVVGFSAALYALTGLQWNIYDCVYNRVIIAASFVLCAVVPQLALIAHLIPFCIGLAVGWIYRLIKGFYETQRG